MIINDYQKELTILNAFLVGIMNDGEGGRTHIYVYTQINMDCETNTILSTECFLNKGDFKGTFEDCYNKAIELCK